jgi:hypothetical protein
VLSSCAVRESDLPLSRRGLGGGMSWSCLSFHAAAMGNIRAARTGAIDPSRRRSDD